MNFWDCMPEYCLTKKVTAVKGSTPITELTTVKSNISVSGATPVTVYSFVPAVSGTLLVRLDYEDKAGRRQIFENGTIIINSYTGTYAYDILTITRGNRYDVKFAYTDGSTGTISAVRIGGVISDDFPTLFISDITE